MCNCNPSTVKSGSRRIAELAGPTHCGRLESPCSLLSCLPEDATCVLSAHGDQKRKLDALVLELTWHSPFPLPCLSFEELLRFAACLPWSISPLNLTKIVLKLKGKRNEGRKPCTSLSHLYKIFYLTFITIVCMMCVCVGRRCIGVHVYVDVRRQLSGAAAFIPL